MWTVVMVGESVLWGRCEEEDCGGEEDEENKARAEDEEVEVETEGLL